MLDPLWQIQNGITLQLDESCFYRILQLLSKSMCLLALDVKIQLHPRGQQTPSTFLNRSKLSR